MDNLRAHGHIQRQLLDVVVAGIISSRSLEGDVRTNGHDHASVGVSSNNHCVVAAKARRPSLERDFTTYNGVKGNLRCPYAKPAHATTNGTGHGAASSTANPFDGQSSNTKCAYDPIKVDQATVGQDRASNTGASARSSAARCPIRYMDDHSPEELAKYFEDHKHEIPRSHAICVSRFQRNSATMRQIDAKYGNLVNMIQGLGERHKALLPESSQNGGTSAERVEKWAEDVSSKSPHPATLSAVEEAEPLETQGSGEDDRASRFERPLREIRVGESPSRPWGIPVPMSNHGQPALGSALNSPVAPIHAPDLDTPKKLTDSEIPSHAAQHDVPSPTPIRPKGKCPFDHMAFMKRPNSAADAAVTKLEDPLNPHGVGDSPENGGIPLRKSEGPQLETGQKFPSASTPAPASNTQSHMIFNGPVFFGYSAEETAVLMQQLSPPKDSR